MPKVERAVPSAPVPCIDVDFGDTDLTVLRYPDGMYVLRIPAAPTLLMNEAQMQELVGAFLRFGKEKGWT